MAATDTNGAPDPANAPEALPRLREAINAVDAQLLELLNQRAALSLEVGRVKGPGQEIFRPGREAALLSRLETANPGPLPEDHLRAIYREILSSSRYLQRPQSVAYLGPEGTFSHVAGLELLGSSAQFQPRHNLAEVFRAVQDGDCDIGIVPLENSLHGSVGQSFDLFLRHTLYITAESLCRIRQSLLSCETRLGDIEVVYSHPQALAQCDAWLRANLPHARIEASESSAAAAHYALQHPASAAIAHSALAQSLELNMLATGIEDLQSNWTRFVVVGRTPADRPGTNKTSIIFAVNDEPGSLSRVLACFAEAGVNLRKLESRPMKGECWKYVFFADLECDLHEPRYASVLEELRARHCHSLRVLGSYPSGIQWNECQTR